MADKTRYVDQSHMKNVLRSRNPNAKKGDYGRVLIVGGSKDYVGAVALAGLAAFRSGVDSVVIAAPEKVAYAINCLSPDLVTKKIRGNSGEYFIEKDAKGILKLVKNADVVLLGNGIGLKKETIRFVKRVVAALEKSYKPYVLDADAIKAVSLDDCKNAILTPHAKELEILLTNSGLNRLNKIKDPEKKITELQRYLKNSNNNNIILLKGKIDYIISKDKVKLNKTGNPGMAKAGTGDVLAGLVAGLLVQCKATYVEDNKFNSACAGAYVNGMLGDRLLAERSGKIAKKAGVYSYIASDLIKDIKNIFSC